MVNEFHQEPSNRVQENDKLLAACGQSSVSVNAKLPALVVAIRRRRAVWFQGGPDRHHVILAGGIPLQRFGESVRGWTHTSFKGCPCESARVGVWPATAQSRSLYGQLIIKIQFFLISLESPTRWPNEICWNTRERRKHIEWINGNLISKDGLDAGRRRWSCTRTCTWGSNQRILENEEEFFVKSKQK